MNTIVWVHGDALSPHNPALVAHPDAPALFVWDDALLTASRLSLKRIVFIYECLLELPVTIRRGDIAAEIARFAAEHGATQVATTASIAPGFRRVVAALPPTLSVTALPVPPFVDVPSEQLDLRRFSRYWRAANRHLPTVTAR